MSNIKATGQFTIVDLSDQRPAQFYLEVNQSKIQVYDVIKKNYSPDFSESSPLVITPRLFFGSSDASELIKKQNIIYEINGAEVNELVGYVEQNDAILKIKRNLGLEGEDIPEAFKKTTLNIVATIKSKEQAEIIDDYSGIELQGTILANVEIIRLESGIPGEKGDKGDNAIFAVIEPSEGRIHFTDVDSENAITLNAYLYEGGEEIKNDVSYSWSASPSLTPEEGQETSSSKSSSFTVTRDLVPGARSFACAISYKGKEYKDAIVLSDRTDPLYCVIESSNGTIFTNHNIQTTLTCRLFKGDAEIDASGVSYSYSWQKNGQSLSTGKEVQITSKDVAEKAVFDCTVARTENGEVVAYNAITLVDLVDSATYIYYAEDYDDTKGAINVSIAPNANSKYIGIYNGPSLSSGQPGPSEGSYITIKGNIKWSRYVGRDGLIKGFKIVGEQVFKTTDGGASYSPSSITLTAECTEVIIEGWYYKNSQGNWTHFEGASDTLTINNPTDYLKNSPFNNGIATIKVQSQNEEKFDIFSVYAVADGMDGSGYTVILSNEMQNIAVDKNFYPLSEQTFTCEIAAFRGIQSLTAVDDLPTEGYFQVSITGEPAGFDVILKNNNIIKFSVDPETAITNPSGEIEIGVLLEGEAYINKSISYAVAVEGTSIIDVEEKFMATTSTDFPDNPSWKETVSETGYGEVKKFLWKETTYYFSDNTSTSKISLSGHYGASGKEFYIQAPGGTMFTDAIDELKLTAVMFENGQVSKPTSYRWYYIDEDESSDADQEENDISTDQEIIVKKDADYANIPLYCEFTYSGGVHIKEILLTTEKVNYEAEATILNRNNIFPASARDDGFVLQVDLYKNNEQVQVLNPGTVYLGGIDEYASDKTIADKGTSVYCLDGVNLKYYIYEDGSWGVSSNSTNYTCQSGYGEEIKVEGFLVYVPKSKIDQLITMNFNITAPQQSDIETNFTIFDRSDCFVTENAPMGQRDGQFWLNTARNPPELFVWRAGQWSQAGSRFYSSQPSSYQRGDLWVARTAIEGKCTENTILIATTTSSEYSIDHWDLLDGEAYTQKQSITQHFDFTDTDGLKIKSGDGKYYIQITSTGLKYFGVQDNANVELASFGNDSANIQSPVFSGTASFNDDAIFYQELKLGKETTQTINDTPEIVRTINFILQVEQDGSLSLARGG